MGISLERLIGVLFVLGNAASLNAQTIGEAWGKATKRLSVCTADGTYSKLIKKVTQVLNGKLIGAHQLEHPGPASEHGGLIIGGHRAGTGRNFEGQIDEITIWHKSQGL